MPVEKKSEWQQRTQHQIPKGSDTGSRSASIFFQSGSSTTDADRAWRNECGNGRGEESTPATKVKGKKKKTNTQTNDEM